MTTTAIATNILCAFFVIWLETLRFQKKGLKLTLGIWSWSYQRSRLHCCFWFGAVHSLRRFPPHLWNCHPPGQLKTRLVGVAATLPLKSRFRLRRLLAKCRHQQWDVKESCRLGKFPLPQCGLGTSKRPPICLEKPVFLWGRGEHTSCLCGALEC